MTSSFNFCQPNIFSFTRNTCTQQPLTRFTDLLLSPTILYVASVLTRAQSFYRAMYSRPDPDLLNFAFVCLSVCRHYVIHISARKWLKCAYSATTLPSILDRKFILRTIHRVFTFSWKYSGVFIKVVKVSVASLEESSALSSIYQRC